MKRQPTAEQQEQARQRREAFKALVKQIGAMEATERAALAARMQTIVTTEGHALSLNNMLLIDLQHPGATIVGGFQQWRRQGRAVRKGEHGAMIWIPTVKGSDGDAEPDAAADVRFFTGTVFDVSQTDEIAAD